MRPSRLRGRSLPLALLLTLAVPALAEGAVTKPSVTTKAASNVSQFGALLNGAVDPNGGAGSYQFQYGQTTLYGNFTPSVPIAGGRKAVNVSAAIQGLAPATRYHFRIVARNAKGLVKGADRTFRTPRQPLALSLRAFREPIRYGGMPQFDGALTGTDAAGRQVVLQSNPWPYTQGFLNVGNVVLTNPDGGFGFLLGPTFVTTQYRVIMPQHTQVVSPIVTIRVQVRISTRVSRHRLHRGHRVRFSGRIVPAVDGQPVIVQRRVRGAWRNVARTVARHADGTFSRYRRRIRVHHGGAYRVVAFVTDPGHTSKIGRTVRLRLRHR